MMCPRCHESLPTGTRWCNSCGFQQVVPQPVDLPPGPLKPVVAGTPVPTHEEAARGRLGWLAAAAAVVLTIGVMVFLSDGVPDRGRTTEAASWDPGPGPTSAAPTAGPDDEPSDQPSESARPRPRRSKSPSPSVSESPTPTTTPTPTTSPTPTPTPTPMPTPTPTRTQPPKASPKPTSKPKPTPTRTRTPSPTPTKPPSTSPAPTPTPPQGPTPQEIADSLPWLSTCGSIARAGHGYAVAHAFWVRLGRPWVWDMDGDGRVCENHY